MKTIGRKIDCLGNCIAEQTGFFIIILNFVLTPFIETKIFDKIPFLEKNFVEKKNKKKQNDKGNVTFQMCLRMLNKKISIKLILPGGSS